jgi:hypothetical protein
MSGVGSSSRSPATKKGRHHQQLPASLHYWWARLERAAGGPKRLRTLMLAFMAGKFVFGLACLLALRSYSSSSSSSSAAETSSSAGAGTGTATAAADTPPLPYRLAATGAQATGLAIGVISGSGPAQRRRVKLLQETWATSLDPATDGLLVFSDQTDAAVPSVGVEGTGASWSGAQDRFFPALSFLHGAFPNAAWYVLVDDDTFVVPRNLRAALARRGDPMAEALYVGRTMFVDAKIKGGKKEEEEGGGVMDGAAGNKSSDKETDEDEALSSSSSASAAAATSATTSPSLLPFAHGGSGVCLSHKLLAAFAPHLETEAQTAATTTTACHGTGYGDGDLALCLHQILGVGLTHEPCLHSSGPWTRTAEEAALDAAFFPSSSSSSSSSGGGGGGGGGDEGDEGGPCSFHQALRREGDKSLGAGRADGAGDEQVWAWHREFNLGVVGGG